ncbi:ribosomal RNA small subunit methyltransferase H [Spirochaetota bacterium]|nr:ribosomal RNA small subunit methyltransferase H [Spirochaetota bacterium]
MVQKRNRYLLKTSQPKPVTHTRRKKSIPTPYTYHKSVLLSHILTHVLHRTDKLIVDATLGEGGHSEAFLTLGKQVIGIESDPIILNAAKQRLTKFSPQIHYINDNFKNIASSLAAYAKQIDVILFDLGISKFHYFKSGRGFSFSKAEPLDMRLCPEKITLTAHQIINHFSEKELASLFTRYGEERRSQFYAQAIVSERRKTPFTTSLQLATFIQNISPPFMRMKSLHPATKIFQALRIRVNDEITILRSSILAALSLLRDNGRVAVISYHSLEDREIKNLFKNLTQLNENIYRYLTPTGGFHLHNDALHPSKSTTQHKQPTIQSSLPGVNKLTPTPLKQRSEVSFQTLTKKVIKPSNSEIQSNASARSAKMRVLIKTSHSL